MRIERTGNPKPLTPHLIRFLKQELKAKSLDENGIEEKHPDFICGRGLLVIEIKSLVDDGKERLENLRQELEDRPDWPHFYGQVPFESIIKNLKDPVPVRRRLAERAGRTIVQHLRKADKQFAAHHKMFPRKNAFRFVILVNEDCPLYAPLYVGETVSRALVLKQNGQFRFRNIDCVLYLTERHLSEVNGRIAVPVLSIEGPSMFTEPWKGEIVEWFQSKWARWNDSPYYHCTRQSFPRFEAAVDVPENMKRHEAWRLEYQRNPYLRPWPHAQLQCRYEDVFLVFICMFLKSSPLKFSKQELHESTEEWTHFLEEVNARGIPMDQFDHGLESMKRAAARRGCSNALCEWLDKVFAV